MSIVNLHPDIAGCVGLWQFQGNLSDSSGGGNTMSVFVGTEQYTTIDSYQAFDFNDASALVAPLAAALQLTGAFTIQWIMVPRRTDQTMFYFTCARPSGGPGTTYQLYASFFDSGSGKIHYFDTGGGFETFTPGGQGTLSTSHVYALRRGADYSLTLFEDGVAIATSTTSNTPSNGTELLRLGNYQWHDVPYLDAAVASFRVLNYARSDAEILADYNYVEGLASPGLQSASTYITDATQPYRPFYYLKITGLPYYFFSIIDPTDSKWGTAAWTLSTGYSAVKGMDLPTTDFSQQLNDIIGGIATAERIRLQMMDFNVVDSHGSHSFFGRLLSPGRISASSSAIVGYLHSDIASSATTSDTFTVQSSAAFSTGDTYIGGETIGVSSVSGPSAGVYTLTIGARNKYSCTSTYPAVPYYRIVADSTGVVDNTSAPLVTQGDPISFIGRSAALYIGHLTPDGFPEPESHSLCRFVGHIRGINYGQEPGKFEFDIESVTADLSRALLAPALAHGTATGIYLPDEYWRTLMITVSANDGTHFPSATLKITLPLNFYTDGTDLANSIQLQLNTIQGEILSLGAHTYTFTFGCSLNDQGGLEFKSSGKGSVSGITGTVVLSNPTATNSVTTGLQPGTGIGLLTAMGWAPDVISVTNSSSPSDGTTSATIGIPSPRVAPILFVPLQHQNGGVTLNFKAGPGIINSRFFTDQGDGSGVAWVRCGDGQVARLIAATATGITIGEPPMQQSGSTPLIAHGLQSAAAYYLEDSAEKTPGTFDQVLHIPSPQTGTAEIALFQLLASTGHSGDGEFNVFPDGCGLALDGLLDKATIRTFAFAFTTSYAFDVDATTTFGDLWTGISKFLGVFLVWDPATATITLRQLMISNSANASTFVFSESNRATTGDRSKCVVDESNLRTGWTVRYGWDYQGKKFTKTATVNDSYAIGAYQIAARTEAIEDRLLSPETTDIDAYLAILTGRRSVFTRYPWSKVTRSVNKTGLLLSPGLYCQIVDNTIFNSFTGLQGITSGDGLYGFITSVRSNLATGAVEVSFLINATFTTTRPWSPTGLLKYTAALNGYSTGTGICTMDAWYTSHDRTAYKDGIDFIVGDKVALVPRGVQPGAPYYEKKGTVTAVATDGSTVTIDSGLGAVSTGVETIMILQDYGSQTTARKTTAATRVTFQGDGVDLLIASSALLDKWT
jgi:hypothetical protein